MTLNIQMYFLYTYIQCKLAQNYPIEMFLPRDAMRKRSLCFRPGVRPSVCLSIYDLSRWCIVSTRLKISSNFFLVH